MNSCGKDLTFSARDICWEVSSIKRMPFLRKTPARSSEKKPLGNLILSILLEKFLLHERRLDTGHLLHFLVLLHKCPQVHVAQIFPSHVVENLLFCINKVAHKVKIRLNRSSKSKNNFLDPLGSNCQSWALPVFFHFFNNKK